MKIKIGNHAFEMLKSFYNVVELDSHNAVYANAIYNNLDINNPIQYCVISYILKPTNKR